MAVLGQHMLKGDLHLYKATDFGENPSNPERLQALCGKGLLKQDQDRFFIQDRKELVNFVAEYRPFPPSLDYSPDSAEFRILKKLLDRPTHDLSYTHIPRLCRVSHEELGKAVKNLHQDGVVIYPTISFVALNPLEEGRVEQLIQKAQERQTLGYLKAKCLLCVHR